MQTWSLWRLEWGDIEAAFKILPVLMEQKLQQHSVGRLPVSTLSCLSRSFGAPPPPEHDRGDKAAGVHVSTSPLPCNLFQTVSVHCNCCVCHTFYTYSLTPRIFMADLLLGVSSSSQAVSLCLQSRCQKRFWLLFSPVDIYISSWVSKGSNHLAAFFGSVYSPSALLTLDAIDFFVMLRVTFGGQPFWWKRM